MSQRPIPTWTNAKSPAVRVIRPPMSCNSRIPSPSPRSEAIKAVTQDHLIREVALFADRTDVSEEAMRLAAHLDQFAELVRKGEEAGRKLEFVLQEMGREANTLGSKAGDVTVSRHVFEIKATLEKIRELVQNVE